MEDYLIDQEDGMKKLLTWFLNIVMQLEAIQQSGDESHERNDERTAHRNGYKKRSLKTRVGEITLNKPQFREKAFSSRITVNGAAIAISGVFQRLKAISL
ncbi:MAG: transposase [Methanothrix sp.]|nr:transposase [Methanothrix sp.]MDD4446722.1 transposase [Methanothrix sp.]